MAYATYEDYTALYGAATLDEAGFTRLIWDAERAMDDATTGIDGFRKLREAPPKDEYGADAVKHCACALTDTLRQIAEAEKAAGRARSMVESADGTVHSGVVASVSSGSESISYATGSAARSGTTAVDAAVSDPAARERLLSDTVRRYLSGVKDANGVNLLYMGLYPVIP